MASTLSPTGRLIEYRLEAMNKSWRWLAIKLDVDESMTSFIRSGHRTLSVELMAKISELLEIPLCDLEYAKAVQTGVAEFALDNVRRRACALAIMRVWKACGETELGQFQRLAELIHIEMVNGR